MGIGAGEGVEEKINDFIKDKDVVDIKLLTSNRLDEKGHPIILALIMYNE